MPTADRATEPAARLRDPCSRWWAGLVTLALALFVVVGASRDNAARPPLGAHGWAPGTWLPVALDPATVSVVLAVAYLGGALGVWLGLRTRAGLDLSWWPVVAVATVALLSMPFGSADHVNYAAYGEIFRQGGDPYVESPIAWAGGTDPITSHVEAPWTTTPSIYGPFATLVQAATALVGGDHLRQVVWVWQVLVVVAWVGARVLLRRLVEDHDRVDVLWTLNPLVVGVGVFGAHIDIVATALALLVVALAVRRPTVAGIVLGLAVCTKVTYAVVGVAVAITWVQRHLDSIGPRAVRALSGCAATVLTLHLAVGPHVYDQLGRARRSVSLATPWRPVVEVLTGPISSATVRNLVFALSAVVALALAAALWRLTSGTAQTDTAMTLRFTFVLSAAYAFAAPYSLPWYDNLAWAALVAVPRGPLDAVMLGRGAVMAVAYVPGRVLGMTPRVEQVTLGVRRFVAPYVGLVAWLALAVLGARSGSPGRSGRRPRGSAPPSR